MKKIFITILLVVSSFMGFTQNIILSSEESLKNLLSGSMEQLHFIIQVTIRLSGKWSSMLNTLFQEKRNQERFYLKQILC